MNVPRVIFQMSNINNTLYHKLLAVQSSVNSQLFPINKCIHRWAACFPLAQSSMADAVHWVMCGHSPDASQYSCGIPTLHSSLHSLLPHAKMNKLMSVFKEKKWKLSLHYFCFSLATWLAILEFRPMFIKDGIFWEPL